MGGMSKVDCWRKEVEVRALCEASEWVICELVHGLPRVSRSSGVAVASS